ncbi:hypothetical protein Zm00014a_019343 [Zea mays]|uniref:Uncharacterized protein n=3 Tax=Zea mays TaxID=4577 RepID=B4FG84_MAIZE|nr:unknown [Zea mays]ONM19243.1 hypothetical protein ZEAMMB73_Zm00001d004583 [Zea mays]PWZ38632.1 hypothetical protein Zm00014a_019343 [Zea mays]|eukprot:NP_001132326.1 uncharacterized protein LOC100193768 [Zea mays]
MAASPPPLSCQFPAPLSFAPACGRHSSVIPAVLVDMVGHFSRHRHQPSVAFLLPTPTSSASSPGFDLQLVQAAIELARPWRSRPSLLPAPRTVIAEFTGNSSLVVPQTVSWVSAVFGGRLARQGVFHQ